MGGEDMGEAGGGAVVLSFEKGGLDSARLREQNKEQPQETGARVAITESVYELLENELFQWETVVLSLPESAFSSEREVLEYSAPQEGCRTPDDSFEDVRGTRKWLFPELASHNLGGTECPRLAGARLDQTQLDSVWKTGTFEVPSVDFPSKSHTWRVNPLLAVGIENLKEFHARSCASSVEHIRYGIPDRLFSNSSPSVWGALKAVGRSLHGVVQATIGIPEYADMTAEIHRLAHSAKVRYTLLEHYDALAEEAVALAEHNSRGGKLHRFFTRGDRGRFAKNDDSAADDAPDILDLRLWYPYYAELVGGPGGAQRVIERLRSEWESERRETVERLLAEQEEGLPHDESVRRLHQSCNELMLAKLENALLVKGAFKEEKGRSLVDRVIATLRVTAAVAKVAAEMQQELAALAEEAEEELRRKHRILSKIPRWLSAGMDAAVRERLGLPEGTTLQRYTELEQARRVLALLEDCRDPRLEQDIYLLRRGLAWEKEHSETVYKEAKEALKEPLVNAKFHMIKSATMGRSYVPVDGTPLWCRSDSFGWRLRIMGARATEICTTLAFTCYNLTAWSPVGLRALLCIRPFEPPFQWRRGSTPTYVSRLRSAFSSFRASVERFEAQPDTGMLGKGVSRIFHRLFATAYLASSLAVVGTLMPVICAGCVTTFAVAAAASPLVSTAVSTIAYTLGVARSLLAATWRIGVRAPVSIFISTLAVTVYHPLCAVVSEPLALLSFCVGYAYSKVTLAVIRRTAKVPAHDTFAARRIYGPGLSFRTYKRTSFPAALAVVRVKLEEIELSAINDRAHELAGMPLAQYNATIAALVKPFGHAQPNHDYLRHETSVVQKMVERAVTSREAKLPLVQTPYQPVRLTPEDYDALMDMAGTLVKGFLTQRLCTDVLSGDEKRIAGFWRGHELAPGSYEAFAKKLLVEGLGQDILLPLTEDDCSVELQLEELPGLRRFLSMAVDGRKPLDGLALRHVAIQRELEIHGPVWFAWTSLPADPTAHGHAPNELVDVTLPQREQQPSTVLAPREQAEYANLMTLRRRANGP